MRITIVGAGPAGLYFAILMKKIDRRHRITVVERNAPDATFGWGVVFSEETLGELRDADYDSFVDITEAFASWDAIDIHYAGRLLRSRGHSFSAISRKTLLALLQRRAASLGVELVFEQEVIDLDSLGDADLIVGADGVNSLVRSTRAEAFGYRGDVFPSKFVWFGTDLVFDAFTFIFRKTEHGVFQAHAYPFDATLSTFIVECNDEVWKRAGLDEVDEEESIAFCEELFAEQLKGHRLLSNRSIWTSFVHVSNQSWRSGNVVLLGDAAHTAHFTIGSGTKLAMEDAVTLANAFVRQPAMERALAEYELERQPMVERFQQAAGESAAYFERAQQYHRLAPMQFAFNLLTRSGRIGYANMTLRDAGFVRALDSWFAAAANGIEPSGIAPPPTFVPLNLAETSFENRVVVSPIVDQAASQGIPRPAYAEALADAAHSGAGLVLAGPVAVCAEGRITPECPTLEGAEQADAWRAVLKAARRLGSTRVGVELNHAGRRGATCPRREGVDIPLPDGGWPLISASAIPYSQRSQVPREMDEEDMARVTSDFQAATALAADLFDVLELNFGQGYLLGSFLSPLSNRREDEHGGSLQARLAFPLRVLRAVADVWPQERPLVARISASDWARGGLAPQEALEVARALADGGCHLTHVVAGQTVPGGSPDYRRSFLTALADRIRNEAEVPTLVGGYVTTVDEINTAVGSGRADLCVLEQRVLATGPAVDGGAG